MVISRVRMPPRCGKSALRLGGTYHNGNDKHLPTDVLRQITLFAQHSPFEKLTRREYALIACGLGAAVLALLPLALHLAGTRWQPGVPTRRQNDHVKV